MNVRKRNNVRVSGVSDGQPMVFVHGFGCDQNIWRFMIPAFEDKYRVVVFDQVGFGKSDMSQYDRQKYASLDGYAEDLLEICRDLDLQNVVLVGHSVSAMTGVLAVNQEPERFHSLILVAPSPRYIDDDGYRGGFSAEDIEGLLESLESNYLGWSGQMAPVIVGNPDRPELGEELTNSFCRTDPQVARQYAQVTFYSDNREDLSGVKVPCLVLQCSSDALAPPEVGEYVHRQIKGSQFVLLQATGHCPNLSAPQETAGAIRGYLESSFAQRR